MPKTKLLAPALTLLASVVLLVISPGCSTIEDIEEEYLDPYAPDDLGGTWWAHYLLGTDGLRIELRQLQISYQTLTITKQGEQRRWVIETKYLNGDKQVSSGLWELDPDGKVTFLGDPDGDGIYAVLFGASWGDYKLRATYLDGSVVQYGRMKKVEQ